MPAHELLVTEDDLTDELWRRGELRWKLRDHQQEIYDIIRGARARKSFLDCARRYGKSFTLTLVAVENGLRNRNWLMRFAAPTMVDLEEIYHPIMEELCEDAPDDIRPVWRTTKGRGHYWFPSTNSKLYMFGTDHENYKKARGKACHFGVVDEAGACDHVEHVVNSILIPQTFGVDGRVFIATTPPDTPGHDSGQLKAQCQAMGSYYKRTINDNTWAPAELKEEYKREAGGEQSTTYRREYLCEWVVDQELAVLPEFTDEKALALVREFEIPAYFHPIEAMDVGGRDWTVDLFAFYDFKRAVLCVEDEIVMRMAEPNHTTEALAAAIKAKEIERWPDHDDKTKARKVYRRVSDIDLILLNDLSVLHGIHFAPTEKDNLEAQVNQVRMWIAQNRIEIHPRCVTLIRQMKSAIWNSTRSEFARVKSDGHFDAVAALIYLVRNTPTFANPFPILPAEINPATHWINPWAAEPSPAVKAVSKMFKRR